MRTINEDGTVKNLLSLNSTMRRQDFPKFYRVNGAIYIQELNEDFGLYSVKYHVSDFGPDLCNTGGAGGLDLLLRGAVHHRLRLPADS